MVRAALFIRENPFGNGKSSTLYVFRQLLNHLQKNKEISFTLFCNDPPTKKLPESVTFRKVDHPYTIKSLFEFKKFLKEGNRVDVVISFDISGVLPIIYAKRIGLPAIVINFAANNIIKFIYTKDLKYFEPIKSLLQLLVFAFADKIITASSFGIENNKIFKHKIVAIGHGVDTTIFKPLSNVTKKENKILFVGKVEKRKGLDIALKVFKYLYDEVPSLTFCIIGEKNKYITKLINKYPLYLRKNIIFKNNLNVEELVQEYNSAKVLILLSRYDGWGLVVTEALACGTPVVVSLNTGAKDIVEKYNCGLVVDLSDTEFIANALAKILKDRKYYKKLSKSAQKAVKEYSWNKVANRFLRCIIDVVNNGG